MRDYRPYLHDIRDAIDSIERFVAGMDYPLVWRTIHERLPVVKSQIDGILRG